MKLIAKIKNYGSEVDSQPYVLEVRLNGRRVFERSFKSVEKIEAYIDKEFGGAEVTTDFMEFSG